MKKALVLALALASVFAFTGCAAGYDSTTDGYGYDNYYNGYNNNNYGRTGYASPYGNGYNKGTTYNGTTYNNGVTNPMYNK